MSATTDGGVARDSFIVIGDCDSADLARHLSLAGNRGCLGSLPFVGALARR
jgi:hypothetical protein